jgi:formamidopyrimidine-DNA glycosylase
MNRDMLHETIVGKTLIKIETTSGKLHRTGVAGIDKFKPAKVNQVIVVGKRLVVELEPGQGGLVSTLGMSGWWYPAEGLVTQQQRDSNAYVNGRPVKVDTVITQAYKYGRVNLWTEESGLTAVYTDARNFGNMHFRDAEELKDAFVDIGYDILNEGVPEAARDIVSFSLTWRELREEKLKRPAYKRKPIGEVLLDQAFIAGLGNIYRAEVLYIAGISPSRQFGELTDAEWSKLGVIAVNVLYIAYTTQGVMRYPGGMLRQYFGFNLPDEYIYEGHLCYGRSKDVKGRAMKAETIGGRTMWYCPEAQT